uniref:Uncharacterized protein n=1 Tax=Anopheles atroparvus TaxID=41427 RepID=A0AAG5D4F5_ANOAO
MPAPLYLIHSPRTVRSDTQQNLAACDSCNQGEDDLQQSQAFKSWLLSRLKLPSSHGIPNSKGNQIHAHDTNELQAILTQPAEAEVCLLSDSPYRILRAAEAGNLEEFIRLYESDNNRLTVKDSKGRTAAHQAAARNRVNILTFIHGQGGNLNAQDMIGNTPLH